MEKLLMIIVVPVSVLVIGCFIVFIVIRGSRGGRED